MTLFEYMKLCRKDEEITVSDYIYDTETYFYNTDAPDDFVRTMEELAKKIDIVEIRRDRVIVNASEVIERNIPALKNAGLFFDYDIDYIMGDFDAIVNGCESNKWTSKFVSCL